jgi:hypothetical protein
MSDLYKKLKNPNPFNDFSSTNSIGGNYSANTLSICNNGYSQELIKRVELLELQKNSVTQKEFYDLYINLVNEYI